MGVVWIVSSLLAGVLIGGLGVLTWASGLRTRLAVAERSASERDAARAEAERWRTEVEAQSRLVVENEQKFAAAGQRLADQQAAFDRTCAEMKTQFEALAARTLEATREQFMTGAKERLDGVNRDAVGAFDKKKGEFEALLAPLRQTLTTYQQRLTESEQRREADKVSIAEQLAAVAGGQQALRDETTRLVTALSRPNARGQWGELTLRRMVELVGLKEGVDFEVQESLQNNGQTDRPDMIVRMPEGRPIVIDAKAPGDAFMQAINSPDDTERRRLLELHAKALGDRARLLGQRAYWQNFKDAPEFVVMFVPSEAMLYAAVECQPAIIDEALRNKVMITSPTSLFSLLKVVELGWRRRTMAENSERILAAGKELYERVGVFAGHFNAVGAALTQAASTYNRAVGSFDGRLMVTRRKFEELGVAAASDAPGPAEVGEVVRTTRFLPDDAE